MKISVLGPDGAYDSRDIFNYCKERNVTLVILVRKNFSGNARGDITRKEQGFVQLGNFKINKKTRIKFKRLTKRAKVR